MSRHQHLKKRPRLKYGVYIPTICFLGAAISELWLTKNLQKK